MIASKRHQGFTLIEILLVLTILGLLSGMLMLSAPHNAARTLESEIRGLQSLLEHTSAAAMRNSEHYGIVLTADEWHLLQFDSLDSRKNGWRRLSWADIGSARSRYAWSDDTQASVSTPGSKRRSGSRTAGIVKPDLIAYANGELSSFTIDVSAKQDSTVQHKLQSDGLNLRLVKD